MRLHEILTEAKQVFDFRHEGSDHPFFGSTKQADFIDPKNGFHWMYDEGILIIHSTNNEIYDYLISTDQYERWNEEKKIPRKEKMELRKQGKLVDPPAEISSAWNVLDGIVDLQGNVITIKKADNDGKKIQRDLADRNEFLKALKELKKYGVTDDFKLKGVPAGIPNTVGKALQQVQDPTKQVFNKSNDQITMYHGTSQDRWEQIQQKGLRPGYTGEAYIDLVPGYSEENVYLATNKKTAQFYAKRQAGKDQSKPVVLKVQVPDPAKIRADDRYVPRETTDDQPSKHQYGSREKGIKAGLRTLGEVAYRGIIRPKFISKA